MGNDGNAIKVWVNKTEVHASDAYGKYSVLSVRTPYILPDTDTVDVTLNKGANPVLVKVCRDGGHNWGFALRITDTQGKVIKGLRLSPDRRK